MANMSSFKHHPTLVVSISTTRRLSPSCFWHSWMQTTASGAFRWGTLGGCLMEGSTQARIWGKGWRTTLSMFLKKTSLPGAAHIGEVPHVMVGDAAFPLKPYLMRPYPGQNLTHKKRIFNYRLSRARMVVENAFGILSSRWSIFHRRINLHPKNVDTLVVAACILHNFLLAPSENVQLLEEAEELGRHMAPVRNMGGNRASGEACAIRESLATFFTSPEGSVSWQDRMI